MFSAASTSGEVVGGPHWHQKVNSARCASQMLCTVHSVFGWGWATWNRVHICTKTCRRCSCYQLLSTLNNVVQTGYKKTKETNFNCDWIDDGNRFLICSSNVVQTVLKLFVEVPHIWRWPLAEFDLLILRLVAHPLWSGLWQKTTLL